MRILFITHRIPYPPNKGDKIRSYNILRHLGKRHEVCLASLIDEQCDLRFVDQVKSLACEFVFDTIRPALRKASSVSSLLQSKPISVAYFYSRSLQRQIDDLIRRYEFSVTFCFSSPMAEYVFRSAHRDGRLRHSLRVMDLVDVDSQKWAQYAQRSAVWKRWIYRYEAARLAHYERKIVRAFDHVLVVSDQEKQLVSTALGSDKARVMTNGVDLHFFTPQDPVKRLTDAPTLVFTGVMDYWPNIEGVAWFAESVLPRIRAAMPDTAFYVVGARPTQEVRKLERLPGVRITGFVEDIRDYIREADVCVVPVRIARGIQNKVLEAMAMGQAVVTTAQALEGIKARAGTEVIQAENEPAFADAVIDLLRDKEKAERLGQQARFRVEASYAWDNTLNLLDEICTIAQDKSTPIPPTTAVP